MAKGYVDADGHVMENYNDMLQFVPEPFNDRGPRKTRTTETIA